MARRKFSRTGGRTPGYQVSPDHFQTASRIAAPDWAEKIPCIILPNQEPLFAKPFGNGPVRLGTQGFFRPFLKTFVAPFRPPPTDCPWVSEDGFILKLGLKILSLLIDKFNWLRRIRFFFSL